MLTIADLIEAITSCTVLCIEGDFFVVWNGSETFRIFAIVDDEHCEEVDVWTASVSKRADLELYAIGRLRLWLSQNG